MSEAIMFVDDEENILHSLRRVFKRQNYEVLTCLSGEEALQVLEQKEVQVMITDQVMPGLKGTELLNDSHHPERPQRYGGYNQGHK